MVYQKDFGDQKAPAYDLRQIYAELIGNTIREIMKYRSNRDYKDWYEELDGLYIDVSCFIADKKENEYYFKLAKELNELIRKNPKAYTSREIESYEIHKRLRQINIFLMKMLKKYDLLGNKPDDYEEGL